MTTFRVIWAVLLDADTAEDAACTARSMQLDANTEATTFNVARLGPGSTVAENCVIDAATLETPTVH